MDDFNVRSLHESKNEWCVRLLTTLAPYIVEGVRSIFIEAVALCKTNGEPTKYLMTFQNLLQRIPKWSAAIVEEECARIIQKSRCDYLEDLVTCIHVIQLKLLTAVRVGQLHKKIDIDIPKLDVFIHRVYVNAARKFYTQTFLFESGVSPLVSQRNTREISNIVQESIMTTVRDSIPVEQILRAYMDATEEEVLEDMDEEVEAATAATEEKMPPVSPPSSPRLLSVAAEPTMDGGRLKFNNTDSSISVSGIEEQVVAPKTIPALEHRAAIAQEHMNQYRDDDDEEQIVISDDTVDIGDIVQLPSGSATGDMFKLDDIEILS